MILLITQLFLLRKNNEIVASKLITKRIDIDNQVIAFILPNEELMEQKDYLTYLIIY